MTRWTLGSGRARYRVHRPDWQAIIVAAVTRACIVILGAFVGSLYLNGQLF